jgi:hypothetical protein
MRVLPGEPQLPGIRTFGMAWRSHHAAGEQHSSGAVRPPGDRRQLTAENTPGSLPFAGSTVPVRGRARRLLSEHPLGG